MRIFLTGGRGMVGRHFLAHPASARHDIAAPTRSALNLLDADATARFIATFRPDLVIHAAGKVGGIQANIREPVQFLVENWDIGRNVVLGAFSCSVRRLINLGSSCMYPRNVDGTLREEMILSGDLEPTNEGYALAKIAVARLCEYLNRQHPGTQFKTLIPCNLYGPYDHFDPADSHLVAAAIRKLHAAMMTGAPEVEVWGTGKARREFMYAGDLADCLHRAIEHFDSLPILMNVGTGEDHSVLEYYEAAASVVGHPVKFKADPSKPEGMKHKLVDVGRSRAWGWYAHTSLLDGLRMTYDYFLHQQQPTVYETSAS